MPIFRLAFQGAGPSPLPACGERSTRQRVRAKRGPMTGYARRERGRCRVPGISRLPLSRLAAARLAPLSPQAGRGEAAPHAWQNEKNLRHDHAILRACCLLAAARFRDGPAPLVSAQLLLAARARPDLLAGGADADVGFPAAVRLAELRL